MSENKETELIQEVEEAHNSDGESVDSEGYSKHDPYAAEAKRLDRQKAAQEAFEMGMVNSVVPHSELENTAFEWGQEILAKSPTAIKMIKFAFNLIDDGLVGQQVFAGEATRLAYMTEEAEEGKNAFLEKRTPNWKKFGRSPS